MPRKTSERKRRRSESANVEVQSPIPPLLHSFSVFDPNQLTGLRFIKKTKVVTTAVLELGYSLHYSTFTYMTLYTIIVV